MLRFSGQLEREAFVIQEEAQLWRYRVLFGENVAGVILTTPEGRIVDCNEVCARIMGFDSKETMLADSDAWVLTSTRPSGLPPRKAYLTRIRRRFPHCTTSRATCTFMRQPGPFAGPGV